MTSHSHVHWTRRRRPEWLSGSPWCTGKVPVLLILGPRLGLGVFLLKELVVEVSMLAMAAGATPVVGAAGWACIGLEGAVVVTLGEVVAAVRSELGGQEDCVAQTPIVQRLVEVAWFEPGSKRLSLSATVTLLAKIFLGFRFFWLKPLHKKIELRLKVNCCHFLLS